MKLQTSHCLVALIALATVAGSITAASLPLSNNSLIAPPTRSGSAGPSSLLQADTDRNRLFDDLEARMASLGQSQALDVIVRYRPGREPALPHPGEHRLARDRSIATRLSRDKIRRLAASGAIESIEEDTVFRTARDTAGEYFGTTRAALDFEITGDGDGDPAGYSDRDHTIAILDTGIDAAHQDFAGGKVIAWQDLVNERPEPYDDNGHGTHCASVAAGAVNPAGVGGAAPGAALVSIKVLDDEGEGLANTIARGVEWCIDHRDEYGIVVINLSLGGSRSSAGNDALSRAVNRAVEAGIVVCCAAGNEGPRSRTIGSPAAAAGAIAVGNMADPGEGGFFLDPSSSRGPTADGRVKPDVCAPGDRISAARANSGSRYARASGTSMASPFVAGVVALLRQAEPGLTPRDVKAVLKETAVHFGAEGENNEYGAGRLDAYAAVARVLRQNSRGPDVPAHLFAEGRLAGTGETATWELTVNDTRFPIAVTLIMTGAGVDFDLALLDSSGRRVAASATRSRSERAVFFPSRTGVYRLTVTSRSGMGDYSLDVSAGAALPLRAGNEG